MRYKHGFDVLLIHEVGLGGLLLALRQGIDSRMFRWLTGGWTENRWQWGAVLRSSTGEFTKVAYRCRSVSFAGLLGRLEAAQPD
jgi:hypothetical protein